MVETPAKLQMIVHALIAKIRHSILGSLPSEFSHRTQSLAMAPGLGAAVVAVTEEPIRAPPRCSTEPCGLIYNRNSSPFWMKRRAQTNADRFVANKYSRTDALVGLGSITPEKNLGLCIEAIGRLRSPRPKLIWVANIANDSYYAEMHVLARKLGVEFEAKLRIRDEELVEILNLSMAMLYAPRLEPFGLAPLEANACGLPAIAIAEGGVRETSMK